MSLLKKLGRIGTSAAETVVAQVIIPWHRRHEYDQTDSDIFALRREVARKTHEGLARSVWRHRGDDTLGEIEFLVQDVEAETLEDGGYVLVVRLMPRNVDFEDENFNPEDIEPLSLHSFLENFVPVGHIDLSDYHA